MSRSPNVLGCSKKTNVLGINDILVLSLDISKILSYIIL
jgi:hypothetical protein